MTRSSLTALPPSTGRSPGSRTFLAEHAGLIPQLDVLVRGADRLERLTQLRACQESEVVWIEPVVVLVCGTILLEVAPDAEHGRQFVSGPQRLGQLTGQVTGSGCRHESIVGPDLAAAPGQRFKDRCPGGDRADREC